MNKNPELLRNTMATILENRDKHNQGTWISVKYADDSTYEEPNICGTTMCFAGFAAVEAGAESPTVSYLLQNDEWWIKPDGSVGTDDDYWDSGDVVRVNRWAGEKLGMNPYEREYIFYYFGDADALAERVDKLATLWESGKEMTDWTID